MKAIIAAVCALRLLAGCAQWDAARRAQRHYSAVPIEAPIEDRPRELPDGRMSVTKIASDAEGREV